MAGGKETPRQKMIGMMYLVLTALLALNVSKSILDAFVAIEANIQEGNLTELFRGNEKRAEISEAALDNSNIGRAIKSSMLLEIIKKIDDETAIRINYIDKLKVLILSDCGEDIHSIGNEDAILQENIDAKKMPLKPIKMKLENVKGKDKYDEPMYLLIGGDIKNPNAKGMELWHSILDYRKMLTETIAASQIFVDDNGNASFDRRFNFKSTHINDFKDQKDLNNKIDKLIGGSNVHEDDRALIIDVYSSLTKKERYDVNGIKNVHWIGKTFDHAPSVAAIASLSSLQKDILAARAKAIALIRSRVGGGEYSFNKIIPLAYGPDVVNANEEFTIEVLVAAYDSDKQPEVTYNGNLVHEIKDGKGYVRLKAGNGKMKLTGTVSIRNKSGVKKTLDWSKEVYVMKPAGSIEIPMYNILYRGYDNIVDPTASGFPETILKGVNVSISKVGNTYAVVPTGNSKQATLIVFGKTEDGRQVELKKITYKVSNLPKPTLYWGGSASGEKIDVKNNLLFAKYGDDVPLNAQFKILDWKSQVSLVQGQQPSDQGNNVSSLSGIVKALPVGSLIPIICRVKTPANTIIYLNGTFIK